MLILKCTHNLKINLLRCVCHPIQIPSAEGTSATLGSACATDHLCQHVPLNNLIPKQLAEATFTHLGLQIKYIWLYPRIILVQLPSLQLNLAKCWLSLAQLSPS